MLPWAFKSITLTSQAEASSIQGLKEEFFAPVVILLRVPTSAAATTTPVATAAQVTMEPSEEPSIAELSEANKNAAEGFLKSMPAFVSAHLYGNLTCCIFLPNSVKTALPETSQNCIDNLRYGSVVVNNSPVVSYFCRSGCWGGHACPESSQKVVGSGLGKLHNFSQIDDLEKFVMEFPWGHSLEVGDAAKIPGFLLPVLAGLTGGGLKGVWAALTP